MVWKGGSLTRRGSNSDGPHSSSRVMSPAETEVRKIAITIGLSADSDVLATVCHKMRKEYVVKEWQLPALDSRQWEKMNAPIGLAAAVRQLSTQRLREQPRGKEKQIRKEIDDDIKQQMHLTLPFRNRVNSWSDTKKSGNKAVEQTQTMRRADMDKNKDVFLSFNEITTVTSKGEESKRKIEISTGTEIKIDSDCDTSAFSTMTGGELAREQMQLSPSSDDVSKTSEFSGACAEWLKLESIEAEKEDEPQQRALLDEEEEIDERLTTATPSQNNNAYTDIAETAAVTTPPLPVEMIPEIKGPEIGVDKGIESTATLPVLIAPVKMIENAEQLKSSPADTLKTSPADTGGEKAGNSETVAARYLQAIAKKESQLTRPKTESNRSVPKDSKVENDRKECERGIHPKKSDPRPDVVMSSTSPASMEKKLETVRVVGPECSDSRPDAVIPSASPVALTKKLETAQVVKPNNSDERHDETVPSPSPAALEKNLETVKVVELEKTDERREKTIPSNSRAPMENSREQVQLVEIEPRDRVEKHRNKSEISLVENDARNETNSSAERASTDPQSNLETSQVEIKDEESTTEITKCDCGSDVATSIFSGLGLSVSFSEDEDDEALFIEAEKVQQNSLLGPIGDDEINTTTDSGVSKESEVNTAQVSTSDDDEITVAISNVTPGVKKSSSQRVKKQKRLYPYEFNRDTSSQEIDTSALQVILVQLPDDDHRTILSQLLIMTNAKEKVNRINLAFQIQDLLLNLIEKYKIDVGTEKAVQLIFHLARLKKSYRVIFGKSLFKAMSTLYKRSEQLKGKTTSGGKKEKKKIVFDLEQLSEEKEQESEQK
mmetsp:Transcript_28888/g.78254  ORF Transcript_28888/g.78254 Transcript_28888/m.78254 type:complete len:835 (+) Transcript_28888:363-2867(+)